jgi:iron complex outermembrane receptor protein
MTYRFARAASVSLIALIAFPAWAEDAPSYHASESSEIIVSAPIQRSRMDVLSGTSVLSGTKLTIALRPTIGETIEHTPGVSATSFGPNASRPVIREIGRAHV